MAVNSLSCHPDMLRVLRELVDQVESGEVEVYNISVTHDIGEGPLEYGCRTFYNTGSRTMEISYRKPTKRREVTIDAREYPMLDSDASLPDYIRRVLVEMGHKGTYQRHEMSIRPGQAPMLTILGVE